MKGFTICVIILLIICLIWGVYERNTRKGLELKVQKLEAEYLKAVKDSDYLNDKIKSLEEKLDSINKEKEKLNEALNEKEEVITDLNEKLRSAQDKIAELQSKIKELETELSQLQQVPTE
jgi:peptidoglycan hydrolase CwlO-like protein